MHAFLFPGPEFYWNREVVLAPCGQAAMANWWCDACEEMTKPCIPARSTGKYSGIHMTFKHRKWKKQLANQSPRNEFG
jgi:hypothetical protein